jgi:hypothetical protein
LQTWVNGALACENGSVTPKRKGQFLRA